MLKLLFKARILLVIVFIAISVLAITIAYTVKSPNQITSPLTIELESGSTIRTLADQLHQHKLLDHPNVLIFWTRINGQATRLQAGEYIIQPGETLADLLNDIVKGKTKQYSLTLVEGWNFKQFMQAINNNEAIEHTLSGQTNSEIMSALGLGDLHPEGMFFPDTYFIHKNTRDVDVLRRAYKEMQRILKYHWARREDNLPFQNAYEALILASIVEKESAVAEERPVIAGVFINRLRKNMRLQTDPSVIYGIGDSYDGDIRFKDLRKDTPYNTYTRRGLTPTPITMPGVGAIEAVMHPAQTQALYFVAINDGSGRHKFSSTLDEHEKAVDLHQRKR